nr:hypothetical protein 7 [Alphaproteobacteria bacterium]
MGALTSAASLIGGITSTLNTIETFVDTVENFGGRNDNRAGDLRAQQDLALKQLQEQQALEERQSAQDAALRRQQLTVEAQNAEERRIRALKRAVSKQRVSFGGRGISTIGGSAEAVLLGLFDESEEELEQRNRLDQITSTALSQDLFQQRSLNVLQATQLRERQNLARAIGF